MEEPFEPKLTFPEDEARLVVAEYARADAILEYGSGGSTLVAAGQNHSYVVSVESDQLWAERLAQKLVEDFANSKVAVHWVDIGATREWGYPASDEGWRRYHSYPTSVWDRADFQDPDIILIDGRFRVASCLYSALRIQRPTKLLFDDYADRPAYHFVEKFFEPVALVGRMAVFELTPLDLQPKDFASFLPWFDDPS